MRDVQFFNLNLIDRMHYIFGVNVYYGKILLKSLFRIIYWTVYGIGQLAMGLYRFLRQMYYE